MFLIHPLLSYLGAILSSYFRVTVIMLYACISLFCISISKGLPVGYLEIENQFCTLFCFTKLKSVTKGILIKALQEQVCRQVDAE